MFKNLLAAQTHTHTMTHLRFGRYIRSKIGVFDGGFAISGDTILRHNRFLIGFLPRRMQNDGDIPKKEEFLAQIQNNLIGANLKLNFGEFREFF